MKDKKNFLEKKINKGIELFKKKKFLDAIEIFNYLKKQKETNIIGLLFLGIIQIQKKDYSFAQKFFFEILDINPNHEDANLNLALTYFNTKEYDKSLLYLDKVIEINRDNIKSIYHKGLIYFFKKEFNKAIQFFEICININKNFFYSYLNLGHIYLRIKMFDKAIDNYKKVIEIDPNNNTSKFNLAWCHFAKLDFENAFEYYEFRKEKTLPGERVKEVINNYDCNEWNGENLDNKTLLILSEQGIGDNIQFFRYLFWIKEKFNVKIFFYADERILNLFEDTPFEIISNLDCIKEIDFYQCLLSLPKIFYNEKKKFQYPIPYIKIDNKNYLQWKNKFKNFNKPIIGINWQGDKNFKFDDTRSISLSCFDSILKIKKYHFISLQKGYGSEQIVTNNYSSYLTDLSNDIDNGKKAFEDTISILKNIDLLITSDTAIAHLAGTLNVNTYLLLSYNPDWRWFIENKLKCFYPNMIILQQKNPEDWDSVFKKLQNLIKKRLTA